MANHDVSAYMVIYSTAGICTTIVLPKIKAWLTNTSSQGMKKRALAKAWLNNFTPSQVAVIYNYLEHGGYANGVCATIGDLNFLVLCGDIGITLRNDPSLLYKAMTRPRLPPSL